MAKLHVVFVAALTLAVVAPAGRLAAQNTAPGGWKSADWIKPWVTDANRKPQPRRSLVGMWGPTGGPPVGRQGDLVSGPVREGETAKRPPRIQVPYSAYGLEVYKSHRGLGGDNAVSVGQDNDPRNRCEPLGVPRYNHYNISLTQIFQDEYKVVILFQYDNRWRVIWTDGRELPTIVDGGVLIDGVLREQRYFGYSVGRWVDDSTLVVQTVGMMPEDRVWLDLTGRPISDKLRVTETFHRVAYDKLVWSETIDDPKMYTRPWETAQLEMRLHDPQTDVMEYYCSPAEQEQYTRAIQAVAPGKGAK